MNFNQLIVVEQLAAKVAAISKNEGESMKLSPRSSLAIKNLPLFFNKDFPY